MVLQHFSTRNNDEHAFAANFSMFARVTKCTPGGEAVGTPAHPGMQVPLEESFICSMATCGTRALLKRGVYATVNGTPLCSRSAAVPRLKPVSHLFRSHANCYSTPAFQDFF